MHQLFQQRAILEKGILVFDKDTLGKKKNELIHFNGNVISLQKKEGNITFAGAGTPAPEAFLEPDGVLPVDFVDATF